MPAISNLLRRLGYAKLSRYGLVLTPEGRVLAMRPAVLDDGLGGKIVGWEDGDLAAAELQPWGAPPAKQAAVAPRVAVAPPPVPQAPARAPKLVVRETSLPISVAPVPAIRPPRPVEVAPAPVAEEDDWEWTIAIARARAAAEEAELAAVAAPPPAPKFVAAKTAPMIAVAPAPRPMAKTADPMSSGEWPKTEPLGEIDYADHTSPMHEVVRVVKAATAQRVVLPAKATPAKAMPVVVPVVDVRTAIAPPAPQRELARAKSPTTIIPVPKLPTIANPRPAQLTSVPAIPSSSAIRPVPSIPAIAKPAKPLPEMPRRMAKGTGPYLPKHEPPPLPEVGDETMPNLVLPEAARVVALPSVLKRARG